MQMAARKKDEQEGKDISQYAHPEKERVNNPPVGLVTPQTDPESGGKKTYAYDPHIDPSLQWAGKTEHASFDVPTVSLHVHERIDPRTIIEAVRKKADTPKDYQPSLFDTPRENPPLREAIDFYKHAHSWSNRLIAGDSLLVMNSLLEKEGMSGKVQMVYLDPPYGIKYSSNFQPFVNQTALKSSDNDEDLTAEPEQIHAFRDTWELGIHSYMTYLRDRLLLAQELLTESGSIFVQISDVNLHRVRLILDEIFGEQNFVSIITVKKGSVMFAKKLLNNACFYVVWYAKNKELIKYRQLYVKRDFQWFADNAGSHLWVEDIETGASRKAIPEERADINEFLSRNHQLRIFGTWSSNAQGSEKQSGYQYMGKLYYPPRGTQWKTAYPEGLDRLKDANRLIVEGNTLRVKLYPEDSPGTAINNIWEGIGAPSDKIYVVQTPDEVPRRCMLITTDPGDLVLDPTCGSGVTAFVAEQWGRRWITCDTSRVAVTLAKQRLMTAVYDYYELAHPEEGVSSGFKYEVVPHVKLKSIANNPEIKEGMTKTQIDIAIARHAEQETLYDQPKPDNTKVRVSGPFTVEAVPTLAVVKPLDAVEDDRPADATVARSGETARHGEWRDELLQTGICGKAGQRIAFSRVEPLAGARWLHADAETKGDTPQRAVLSFGPTDAPLEQRQVALAVEEATSLYPRPAMLVFAAFHFDPEAAKDIDDMPASLGITLLKVQMNTDLLTDDLKKKRSSNQSFWLIGQPDVELRALPDGAYQVEVLGFDYYNPITGTLDSGDTGRIAVWMLDTDYDGRSLYPRQVFFPMAGEKDGWAKLARNLKAELDEDRIDAYRGTVSLSFEPGTYRRVAVKIVDDRGIESLKLIQVL